MKNGLQGKKGKKETSPRLFMVTWKMMVAVGGQKLFGEAEWEVP